MLKRLAATLGLALLVLGCGLLPDPVQLVTGPPDGDHRGCFAAVVAGLLVVDPTYGTAIVANHGPSMVQLGDVPVPVVWRTGFTARRSGSEVEVLDPQGTPVAITGRNYKFFGGYVSAGIEWPDLPTQAIWACDDVQQLP